MPYDKYTKDANGNEIVQNGEYAETLEGDKFYPKNKDSNEYADPVIGYILDRNNEIKYPLSTTGEPIYPIINGDEFYYMKNNIYYFGKNQAGRKRYAVDQNRNQFYPPDNSFITSIYGGVLYALDKDGMTVFPIDDKNNEYYFEKIDVGKSMLLTRYARTSDGCELYPNLAEHTNYQLILNDKYATDANGEKYYPVDDYCNELYMNDMDRKGVLRDASTILLNRYALTWDFKVILPEINNTHYIDPVLMPTITEDDILGKLKRSSTNYKDYLTKQTMVKGIRPVSIFPTYFYQDKTTSNDVEVKKFTVKTTTRKSNSWYMWVILVVVAFVPLLIYSFFFYKSASSFSMKA